MAREYVVSAPAFDVAGASTLVFVRPSATCAIEVLRLWVSNHSASSSAQVRIRVNMQGATLPTLATGVAPAKTKQLDPISQIVSGTAGAAGTAGVDATTESTGKTTIFEDAFNILNGWLWVPTPRETLIVNAGNAAGIAVDFPAAPSTLTGWAVGLVFAELG